MISWKVHNSQNCQPIRSIMNFGWINSIHSNSLNPICSPRSFLAAAERRRRLPFSISEFFYIYLAFFLDQYPPKSLKSSLYPWIWFNTFPCQSEPANNWLNGSCLGSRRTLEMEITENCIDSFDVFLCFKDVFLNCFNWIHHIML